MSPEMPATKGPEPASGDELADAETAGPPMAEEPTAAESARHLSGALAVATAFAFAFASASF